MGQTNYLLDTNIIFNDPYVLNKFKDCIVYIPSVVLEEIDKYKYDKNLGMQVRIFGRILDKLHENDNKVDNNVEVRFIGDSYTNEQLAYLGGRTNDNVIIHMANVISSQEKVILLSNDTLVRVKARNICGLEATGFTQEMNDSFSDEFYKGYLEVYLEDELIDKAYKDKFLPMHILNNVWSNTLYPNSFVILKRFSGRSGDLIAKVDNRATCIEVISDLNNIYGINPKNIQQLMALHLLLDPEIPLVTLSGKAGSGKTLLALAAGLLLVQDLKEPLYKRITCATPTVDMGKGIGFLPGDMKEKIAPYVQSFYDALEYIYGGREQLVSALAGFQDEFQIDALNYIRGRSLPDQFFIVDEAQNLTKHEVKTIITRMGDNSKIILMGDPAQIDVPYLDKYNNGLSYVIDKFKDKGLAGHIELLRGVRSPLADMAADIL